MEALKTTLEVIAQLQKLGFAVNGNIDGYDLKTVITRFQATAVGPDGVGIDVDGQYGKITEAALFRTYVPTGITLAVLAAKVATAMIGVSEIPPGSNKGPQIEMILKTVGLPGGYPWCAAFTHWCYKIAANQLGITNPHPKDAGVLNLWRLAGYKDVKTMKRISAESAQKNPQQLKMGDQMILEFKGGGGHTGLFIVGENLAYKTVEGNSNNGGSREGIAVYPQTKRNLKDSTLLGFIRYV